MSNRNNLSRLGLENVPTTQETDPIVQSVNREQTNITYSQPIDAVDLPTEGKFYPESHPLHNVDYVEMREMTASDVEILNSRTLLQKGVALDKMLQGLLINKKIDINSLYLGDKNALIIRARILGFTPEYITTFTCPSCGEKSGANFNLLEIKSKEVPDDVEISQDGTFELILPKSKRKIRCKLLTGNDEKILKAISEKKQKHKLPETPITDQLKQIITSVDDVSDREVIEKFVSDMFAIDSNFIRKEYTRISPNVDLTKNVDCEKCLSEQEITIPLTTDFFWPKQ